MTNGELAQLFLNAHDPEEWFRDQGYTGPCEAIDSVRVDELAGLILDFVANVVANIIDAGSERDAVNENEALLTALREELQGWTSDAG